MSGGLFGTPLSLNPKCLLFATFILAIYWMPHSPYWAHETVIGFILATAAYVILAWYDVIYDCNDHLKPTLLGWLSMPFKPAEYKKGYDNLPIKYKKIVRNFDIAVLGILVVLTFTPYFLYSKSRK